MAIIKRTTFSESNVNTTKNTSTLTINVYFSANNSDTWFSSATLSCTCNGTTQKKTVSHPRGGSASASFTFNNIVHNNDGTKTVNWSWKCPTGTYTLGTVSASGSKALTRINRQATLISAPDFNDEQSPTITYSNLAGNSVNSLQACISLTGARDDITYRDISKTGTSYTFNLTTAERNFLRTASKNTSKLPVRFFVTTNINGTYYYSIINKTMSVINANPIFTDFDTEDVNTTTTAITGDSSKFILGYSNLRITIDNTKKATPLKNADMKYYLINNVQYSYQDNFSVDIPNYNSDTVTVTAVDSRGFSTSVTKTLTLAEYSPIQKESSSIERLGNVNEETKLSYNGKATYTLPNGNQNTLVASYRYKKAEESTYTTGTTNIQPAFNNDGNFRFEDFITGDIATGFEIDNTYNVIVTISDVLSTIEYELLLNSGIPAIAVKGNNVALHGGYDESTGGTQIYGDVYLDGELLSDFVVEKGNNYIKYNSGNMIQWGTQEVRDAVQTAHGALYRTANAQSVSFSQSFGVNYPTIFLTPQANLNMAYISGYINDGKDGFEFYPLTVGSSAASTRFVKWLAIGQWK